jgi:hypothetical protein
MMHGSWKPSAELMQQGSTNGSRSLGGSTNHGGNVRVEQAHQRERRHPHPHQEMLCRTVKPDNEKGRCKNGRIKHAMAKVEAKNR